MNYSPLLRSRIHPLNQFGRQTWVKRDDELSFGVSGSKARKLHSLIPQIRKNGHSRILAIGGAHSNNILALAQACAEWQIGLVGLLLGPPRHESGIAQLMRWFQSPHFEVQWISRRDWPHVLEIADSLSRALMKQGESPIVLPEGSMHPYAIPGSMTLASEIARHQEEEGLVFDRIFIDSGSGMTSQSLIAGLAYYPEAPEVQVVQLAKMDPESYQMGLEKVTRWVEDLKGPTLRKPRFRLIEPSMGRSFGSTPQTIFREIKRIAQEEGFLTDPIYSGKLFFTAREHQSDESRDLLIHSGGGLALTGFLPDMASSPNIS